MTLSFVVWDVDVVDVDVSTAVLAFFNLIDSSAHHSEREIIVTHGRFQSLATVKLNNIIIVNKDNNQIFLTIFIFIIWNLNN